MIPIRLGTLKNRAQRRSLGHVDGKGREGTPKTNEQIENQHDLLAVKVEYTLLG
jgi:hypothetical protein